MWDFQLAGHAPGGPEDDYNVFSFQVGYVMPVAFDVSKGYIRSGLAVPGPHGGDPGARIVYDTGQACGPGGVRWCVVRNWYGVSGAVSIDGVRFSGGLFLRCFCGYR